MECSIPKVDRGILHQDWTNYAPGYPFNTEDASRGWNLGDHEYAKHGTCTNLTSLVYLKEGIRLMKLVKTPPKVYLNVGHSVQFQTFNMRIDMTTKILLTKLKRQLLHALMMVTYLALVLVGLLMETPVGRAFV